MNDIAILEPPSRQAKADALPAASRRSRWPSTSSKSSATRAKAPSAADSLGDRRTHGQRHLDRRNHPGEISRPRAASQARGNRIRIGAKRVTNGGDETDLVIAFNEQVLLALQAGAFKPGCTILLESMWREHIDADIAAST